jgi:TetR/AcrR family transcriptional regulator, tetracycline repressor protein
MAAARRRTGPARSLTREQVVDVAIDVMSGQGLDAVSFRTVAMRMGVDPKALYTYVNDKDDLLAAMFDKILGELDVPVAGDPRLPADRIVALLVSLRRALIRNPDTYRLARPLNVAGLNADALERMAETLHELGWDTAVAVRVYGRLVRYTIGSAISAHHFPLPNQPNEAVAAALDTERHPHALDIAETGPFVEDDANFAAAIRIMLEQRIGES